MQTNMNHNWIKDFTGLFQAVRGIMEQDPRMLSADLYKWDPAIRLHIDAETTNHEFFAALDPDYGISPRSPYNSSGPHFTIMARIDSMEVIAIMDEQELRERFPDRADELVAEWYMEYGEGAPMDKPTAAK